MGEIHLSISLLFLNSIDFNVIGILPQRCRDMVTQLPKCFNDWGSGFRSLFLLGINNVSGGCNCWL